ncbi:unnamed protein product [Vitrella brassicaformis CCMP3155]|uniref:Uncharacterized protein n=2 Tax=Vitrella brassicaformis TaxID=1169539 RepID=A0A0G4FJ05_VITBC|nr:unnamed protein product [Vitrella brassicaformis CCMP3155]|eukprot:CEM13744.1 unnamed protein product [Vitrella brassicaformis CCMP3155]
MPAKANGEAQGLLTSVVVDGRNSDASPREAPAAAPRLPSRSSNNHSRSSSSHAAASKAAARKASRRAAPREIEDSTARSRRLLISPEDQENQLLKIACVHGPAALLTCLLSRQDVWWWVRMGLRAVEVAIGPRPTDIPYVDECDPTAYAQEMIEMGFMEPLVAVLLAYIAPDSYTQSPRRARPSILPAADEPQQPTDAQKGPAAAPTALANIHQQQQQQQAAKGPRVNLNFMELQTIGLKIVERLVTDDVQWRTEICRVGGVPWLCEVGREYRERAAVLSRVVGVIAFLAAEEPLEVFLQRHDALDRVLYAICAFPDDREMVTKALLALLNLTKAQGHVLEVMERDLGLLPVLVLGRHWHLDVAIMTILCGVLAHLASNPSSRQTLVDNNIFDTLKSALRLDTANATLQAAALKAVVPFALNKDFWTKMEEEGIIDLVAAALVEHPTDVAVMKYGEFLMRPEKPGRCFTALS